MSLVYQGGSDFRQYEASSGDLVNMHTPSLTPRGSGPVGMGGGPQVWWVGSWDSWIHHSKPALFFFFSMKILYFDFNIFKLTF